MACIPLGVASQNLDQRVGHSLEVLPVERDDLDLSRGLHGRGPFGVIEESELAWSGSGSIQNQGQGWGST